MNQNCKPDFVVLCFASYTFLFDFERSTTLVLTIFLTNQFSPLSETLKSFI